MTILVNDWRDDNGNTPSERAAISVGAVKYFIQHSSCVRTVRRGTKKSGKTDVNSAWAKARKAQCEQWREQLRLGTSTHGTRQASTLPPMRVDGIVWWDEHHQKTRCGHASKHVSLVSRDPATGKASKPVEEGGKGVFPEVEDVTSVKYEQEGRGCFGAAVRQGAGGVNEGVKCEPFFYTGFKIIGWKKFEKLVAAELKEKEETVSKQKGRAWENGWRGKGYGYKQRYPETWRAEVVAAVERSTHNMCVTKLMDHVVAESKKVYAGTAREHDFLIFHDALSAWWEEESQQHMATLGFRDRQLKCITANTTSKTYKHKLVGDSPELCRTLDSHGFGDLKDYVRFASALSSVYEVGDPRRFGMGTPDEVQSSMARAWTVVPTSARIVEDAMRFEVVLDKIIAAGGAVVPDEVLRTGRRALRSDGQGECAEKPRKKQRKETLMGAARPIHPDLVEARQMLLGGLH